MKNTERNIRHTAGFYANRKTMRYNKYSRKYKRYDNKTVKKLPGQGERVSGQVLPSVLVLSISLQIASAAMALVLIYQSGFHKPWLLISAAIALMAIRRITSFVQMLQTGVFPSSALGPELIALAISILMLLGLLCFGPAFGVLKKQREQELSAKDTLIRESHHHVKNDLQLLSSMVSLQEDAARNKMEKQFLRDLELRIRSFSLLHEYIYKEGLRNNSFRNYISSLSSAVADSYSSGGIRLETHLENLEVNRKNLLYCGLVLNEVLTNAYKYAFPDQDSAQTKQQNHSKASQTDPTVTIVSSRTENGSGYLRVSDNGAGLPEDADNGNRDSYGFTLIRTIGDNPGWEITVTSSRGASGQPSGTTVEAFFPVDAI
jgi:two-component sensor histidine kinase